MSAAELPIIMAGPNIPVPERYTMTYEEQKFPVARISPEVRAMRVRWQKTVALMGGTDAMRAAGKTFLPAFEKEKDDNYNRRLSKSTCFPAFKRTVTSFAGKPFSRPITFDEKIPPALKELFEDIDREGRNIDTVMAERFEVNTAHGVAGILVDYPQRGAIPNTIAAEKEAGLRPYFVPINFWNILGWKFEVRGGKKVLTQIRFFEDVKVSIDDYNDTSERKIRVYGEKAIEVWKKNDKEEWFQETVYPNTIGVVPFAPMYGTYKDFMIGEPALYELANLNIKHWQSQSDQDFLLNVARVPILTIQTDDETFELVISGNMGVNIPIGSECKFVEHTGKAIEAGAKSLEELKDEMRQAGAELLVLRMTEATATEVTSDNSVGICQLQRMVNQATDAMNLALKFMCLWLRLDDTNAVGKIFNEFSLDVLDQFTATLIYDMSQGVSPIISRERTYKEFQRRSVLQGDIPYKDEQELIDKQKPATAPIDPNKIVDKNQPAPIANAQ